MMRFRIFHESRKRNFARIDGGHPYRALVDLGHFGDRLGGDFRFRLRGGPEDRFDIAPEGTISAQRIVRLVEPLDRQTFLFHPVGLAVSGRTKLPVCDFSVERQPPVAIQASYVISP